MRAAAADRGTEPAPPVSFIARAPVEASAGVEAFVRPGIKAIYIVISTPMFETLLRQDDCAISQMDLWRKLASVIVHEEWHLRHGADEEGAYAAQLMALALMGNGNGQAVYEHVRRTMRIVHAHDKARGRST